MGFLTTDVLIAILSFNPSDSHVSAQISGMNFPSKSKQQSYMATSSLNTVYFPAVVTHDLSP